MNEKISLPRKAKGERPSYTADAATEKALSIVLALAGEVSVLRDRIDTLERSLELQLSFSRRTMGEYVPDAAARAERDGWREAFLGVILRVVHQDREDLELRAQQIPYEEAVRAVETQ